MQKESNLYNSGLRLSKSHDSFLSILHYDQEAKEEVKSLQNDLDIYKKKDQDTHDILALNGIDISDLKYKKDDDNHTKKPKGFIKKILVLYCPKSCSYLYDIVNKFKEEDEQIEYQARNAPVNFLKWFTRASTITLFGMLGKTIGETIGCLVDSENICEESYRKIFFGDTKNIHGVAAGTFFMILGHFAGKYLWNKAFDKVKSGFEKINHYFENNDHTIKGHFIYFSSLVAMTTISSWFYEENVRNYLEKDKNYRENLMIFGIGAVSGIALGMIGKLLNKEKNMTGLVFYASSIGMFSYLGDQLVNTIAGTTEKLQSRLGQILGDIIGVLGGSALYYFTTNKANSYNISEEKIASTFNNIKSSISSISLPIYNHNWVKRTHKNEAPNNQISEIEMCRIKI